MGRTRSVRGDGERRAIVEMWRASGLSGRKFAIREGLSPSSLARWSVSFPGADARERAPVIATAPGFARIEVVRKLRAGEPRELEGELRLRTAGGHELSIGRSVDAATLRMVLEVLEAC